MRVHASGRFSPEKTPGTSHCGSSVAGSSTAKRIPASTGSAPSYRTVRPSKSKPRTGEPSGASALHTSIPALLAQCARVTLFAGQEVDDVVLGHDAESVVRGRSRSGARFSVRDMT